MGMREGSGFVCPVILRHRATQNSGWQRQLATRTVTLILFTAAASDQIVPDRLHIETGRRARGEARFAARRGAVRQVKNDLRHRVVDHYGTVT